jgi:arsenite methyltransferase
MAALPDRWSQWLLSDRDAGDPDQRSLALERLAPIRDRLLAGAEPLVGTTLLDVGSGDGLVALEAARRVGPAGRVILCDPSPALLEAAREEVRSLGLLGRTEFVSGRAEDLAPIASASVDVVTTRSVLIYVAEKGQALGAFLRVLRPGGRVSLFEPINRLMFPEPRDRFWGYDVAACAELADRVKAAFTELEGPGAATRMDFDDRDLVRLAEQAGFARISCECRVEVEPGPLMEVVDLDALLDSAPNPFAPTPRKAIEGALTGADRDRFLSHLSQQVREGAPVRRWAGAYLVAQKLA